jgi:hypothetical protein
MFKSIGQSRHRKKKYQVKQDEGTVIGKENIKNYISEL